MKHLIFENKSSHSIRDLLFKVGLMIVVLIIVKLLLPIRSSGSGMTNIEFAIFGCVLTALITIDTIRDKTVKFIETTDDQLIVTYQRLFGGEIVVEFNMDTIDIDMNDEPDRLRPKNTLLVLKDDIHELRISSRQKGLSEEILRMIKKNIDTAHNKR